MLENDSLADRQPQASTLAFFLGGEKRLEYAFEPFRWDTGARIDHFDHDSRCPCQFPRMYPQGEATAFGHGIGGIGEKVKKHLPQMLPISVDQRHVGAKCGSACTCRFRK